MCGVLRFAGVKVMAETPKAEFWVEEISITFAGKVYNLEKLYAYFFDF